MEFAVNAILRAKGKNIFIVTIFTLLVALLASIFFIVGSIRYEQQLTLDSLPEIIVQKVQAGRVYDIENGRVENIITISGVESAIPRVWGYYYFANAGVNLALVGINQYEEQYKGSLEKLIERVDFDILEGNSSMVVGAGVKRVMEQSYFSDYLNFIKPNGELKRVTVGGIFREATELETNDMVVMGQRDAREILGIAEDMATDIVVKVANPEEIPTIAQKIKLLYPDTRVITKADLEISYQNIFDYKSGVFLALFSVALFTFFMIIYDRSSGLSSEEKREIGILRAVGWSIDDILKEKFYEGFIISISAYTMGIILALGFVYILQAPILRGIFEGYSELRTSFNLPFILNVETLALIFFLTVPIYIASTIVPAWRASSLDVDEVIR
jgi:ABC-type lipoprotein release transport system permease subunit